MDGITRMADVPQDAAVYMPKALRVHAVPERNERMGLYGRDGFRVIYPGGMSVWLPDDVFAAAFAPSDAYWAEARTFSTPVKMPVPAIEGGLHGGHVMVSSRTRWGG
jgi:hypothetical protein